MTLDRLDIGKSATVMGISDGTHGDRLMEMGLVPGTAVRVLRRAPWRGPLQLSVRGTTLCVDHAEARTVELALAETGHTS